MLEGGYSIEKALPYVNVGIILAMAGLDYSQVREPDYDAQRIRQSPEVTRFIENEVKKCNDAVEEKKEPEKTDHRLRRVYPPRKEYLLRHGRISRKNKSKPSVSVMIAAAWS